MAIFDKLRKMRIENRKLDETLYSVVAQEMERGIRYDGLWIMALEKAKGDKDRQLAEYIRIRVQALKDELSESQDEKSQARSPLNFIDIEDLISSIENGLSIEEIERSFTDLSQKEVIQLVNTPDAGGDYPIHVAAKFERADVCDWLISVGADPSSKNYWDSTALEIAQAKGNAAVAAILQKCLA